MVVLAQHSCIKNIADITDVGELRYDILEPILRRIENPAQLVSIVSDSAQSYLTREQRQIEESSPHIAEDDAELWKRFIKRDISSGEKKVQTHRPKNPSSWWKVYRKLKKEDQMDQVAAEEALKAALNKHKAGKEANTTQIVHAVIPSGEKRSGWSSGPREKPQGARALANARTAAQQLTILKRQTASRQQGRSVAQSTPSHQLQQMRGRVAQAPASMVRQYAGNPAPAKPPPAVTPSTNKYRPAFVPKPQTHADRALTTAIQQTKREQEERERRLRNLTGASNPASSDKTPAPAQGSAPQMRKRPAYDPFLPSKRRRP